MVERAVGKRTSIPEQFENFWGGYCFGKDLIFLFRNPNVEVSDAFLAAIWNCRKIVTTIVTIIGKVNRNSELQPPWSYSWLSLPSSNFLSEKIFWDTFGQLFLATLCLQFVLGTLFSPFHPLQSPPAPALNRKCLLALKFGAFVKLGTKYISLL